MKEEDKEEKGEKCEHRLSTTSNNTDTISHNTDITAIYGQD